MGPGPCLLMAAAVFLAGVSMASPSVACKRKTAQTMMAATFPSPGLFLTPQPEGSESSSVVETVTV